MGGQPGVYSARFAGASVNANENMDKVLRLMEGVSNRKAIFRTVIALYWQGQKFLFEGCVHGTIIDEKRGVGGCGYDPIFVPEGYEKTFAELTPEIKNKIGSSKSLSLAILPIGFNFLFASAGERGQGMIAQDPTKHPGSVIRINIDGSIPKDNPKFKGKSDWLPEIYQIGIRNPQGLTLSPFDGKIYMSNHGARGGDWFGEAKKGENYGWKILGWGGTNYSGIPIGPKWKPGFTKAIKYWVPSIATSAITIYKGKEFSEWNGHALVTSLKDKSLRKLIFDDLSNVKEDIIFKNKIGRIRDIQVHPNNGKIYFLGGDKLWLMQKN